MSPELLAHCSSRLSPWTCADALPLSPPRVNPIGFENLGTNYYWPYVGVIAVNLVVVYFLFPETAGLTRSSPISLSLSLSGPRTFSN